MPESKSRHPHKHSQQHHHHDKPLAPAPRQAGSNRVVTIAIIFFAVIGLLIGFLIESGNALVLITGLVLGAGIGYVAGKQFKKSLSGK